MPAPGLCHSSGTARRVEPDRLWDKSWVRPVWLPPKKRSAGQVRDTQSQLGIFLLIPLCLPGKYWIFHDLYSISTTSCAFRCTLHPNDSLAMEGPLSRVKSLKKSLRQSFRRIRKSRVSGKKRTITTPTSKVMSFSLRRPHGTIRLNLFLHFMTVLHAGPRGQRCFSGAGGSGSGTAKDWTAVSWWLAVRSGPMSLLRWHLPAWWCVHSLVQNMD